MQNEMHGITDPRAPFCLPLLILYMPVTRERFKEVMGGEWNIRPQCPHCLARFDNWSHAKLHVKFCAAGKNPRKSLHRTAQRGYTPLESQTEKDDASHMKLTPQQVNSEMQLLPSMLTNLGDTCKIVDVLAAGKKYQYSDIYIVVQFSKRKYEVPVRFINEDFQDLATKLGMDTDKWAGKMLHFSVGEYTSNKSGKTSDILRFELSAK